MKIDEISFARVEEHAEQRRGCRRLLGLGTAHSNGYHRTAGVKIGQREIVTKGIRFRFVQEEA
jgi:hypothetical protein